LSYRLLRQNLHEQGTRLDLLFFVAIVFFSAVLKIKDNFFFLQASQETSPQPGTALLCQKPQSPGTRKALLRSLWQL
jgi:hypothetical protein